MRVLASVLWVGCLPAFAGSLTFEQAVDPTSRPLSLGQGGEIRRPMAIAVIGGLVISTALSLLVVPAFYLLADRLKARLTARRAAASPPPSPAPTAPTA